MNERRARREARCGGRYVALRGADPRVCWYCLAVASGVDHVPPLCLSDRMPQVDHVLVPACWECNRRLSIYPGVRLSARVGFLWIWTSQIARWASRRGNASGVLAHCGRLRARWIQVRAELVRRGRDPDALLRELEGHVAAQVLLKRASRRGALATRADRLPAR